MTRKESDDIDDEIAATRVDRQDRIKAAHDHVMSKHAETFQRLAAHDTSEPTEEPPRAHITLSPSSVFRVLAAIGVTSRTMRQELSQGLKKIAALVKKHRSRNK